MRNIMRNDEKNRKENNQRRDDNLDEDSRSLQEILEQKFDVEPKVVIYGIVNSLISNGKASRVQISVEGETSVKFQEAVYLNEPFDRNVELVEHE